MSLIHLCSALSEVRPVSKWGFLFILLMSASSWAAEPKRVLPSKRAKVLTLAQDACGPGETWSIDPTLPAAWVERFEQAITSPEKPPRAEVTFDSIYVAQRLKGAAKGEELRALSDYWVARALYGAGFTHLANENFAAMVESQDRTLKGIQLASIECLSKIHRGHATLPMPPSLRVKLADLQRIKLSLSQKEIVWNAAFELFLSELTQDSKPDLAPTLMLLKGSGSYEKLAQGWIAVRDSQVAPAIDSFEKFLASERIPPHLQRFVDPVRLNLGRLYASQDQFQEAVQNFKKVSRSSNFLGQALADQAWTELVAKNYGASIGVSMDIRRTGLKKSFAPHALLAAAISLFELCRYPESLRAALDFRRSYRPSLDWLRNQELNRQVASDSGSEYQQVVAYIKGETQVPDPVGTEWVRSPLFQSLQIELNLLLDERILTQFFLKRLSRVKAPKGNLPLQQILAAWTDQLNRFLERSKKIELELIAKIGDDIRSTNKALLGRLQALDDEVEFLNTEIYDSAGEDIVWKNVNRDFDQYAKKHGETTGGLVKDASQVMVWDLKGVKKQGKGDGAGEVWEDELGALATDQLDYCRTKTKFLRRKNRMAKTPKDRAPAEAPSH